MVQAHDNDIKKKMQKRKLGNGNLESAAWE
jgi:hypothetical protein